MQNDATDGFATTRWSVVAAAGDESSPEVARALSTLCQTYWVPVHGYIRRRVSDPERARDLTQEFFTRLLEGNGVAGADAERGRFRAYLLGAVKHFLSDEAEKARARSTTASTSTPSGSSSTRC